jgi:hypothetical protein
MAKAMPGRPSRHLFGGEDDGVHLRLVLQAEGQGAEGGDGVHDHPPAGGAHGGAHGGDVVDDAAAGLGIDDADMADGGVSLQRLGDFLGRDAAGVRHGEEDDLAAGFTGQAGHALGIGAVHHHQQLVAVRDEGAYGGFGDEVAGTLQRQADMLAGEAAGKLPHCFPDGGVFGFEVVVPRGDVHGHGRPDFGTGLHGAGDEEQHGRVVLVGRGW